MNDYKKLLAKAKKDLPKDIANKSRFDIPKVSGHVQGNKTVITNFNQIVSLLQRDPNHLLKYLQRELAAPAQIDGPRLVLNRKISAHLINTKIEQYAKDFLICLDCGKPDTKIIKENNLITLKCTACGAKNPIKSKIY